MCLDLLNLEERRQARGVEKGYEWEIVHNEMGYRCGYIRLEPGHPWFGQDSNDIDAQVHGGLTYAVHGKDCPAHGAAAEWWIGFDCAHAYDAPDYSLPGSHHAYRRDTRSALNFGATVRDDAYVRKEIEGLITQAIAAAEC